MDALLVALEEHDEDDRKERDILLEQQSRAQKGQKKSKRKGNTKKAAAMKTKAKGSKKVKEENITKVEDVDEEIMSLADRLKSRMNVTPVLARKRPKEATPLATEEPTATITPAQKPKEKKAKKKAAPKPKGKPKEEVEEVYTDSDDDAEEVVELKKKTPRAKRTAATKKSIYVFDSEEEEDFDDEGSDFDDEDY